MIARLVSLLIVLGIVAMVAWGVSLLPWLPRLAARLAYTACAAITALLIVNFAFALMGHPWFEYGGNYAP